MPYYNTPVLRVPNATESTKDAAQYMIYRGLKQYNLCMEFCVAFMMRDNAYTDNIDDFLNYWEAVDIKWWNSIFRSNLARTTGIYDIKKALAAYGVQPTEWREVPIDFASFEAKLTTHQAIVGVNIDYKGYLVGKGIPHWEVLDGITIFDDNHAMVSLYNPYNNLMEPYSWKELMTSTGSYKQGLWVER